MARVAVAIDDWKQEIFERELAAAGFSYNTGPGVTPDSRLITVITEDHDKLEATVRRCQQICANQRRPGVH